MKKGFVNFYEILLCCTKSSESMFLYALEFGEYFVFLQNFG